jgi:hypothetical protein
MTLALNKFGYFLRFASCVRGAGLMTARDFQIYPPAGDFPTTSSQP